MQVTLEMYHWAKSLMVCAPAWECPKEEACFHLAQRVIAEWEQQEHSAAMTRAEAKVEVAHYAPHFPPVGWEWHHVDWDAA